MLKELYETFMRALIRFFENRFLPNVLLEEIEYLKLELNKERDEKKKLLNFILELNKPEITDREVDVSNYKPINSAIPWSVRKQQLEREDRELARSMKEKSTEQLEEELGISNATE